MLASHAALCASTGSLEMLVFHTLFAGNIGQFGAPGTVVDMTGAVTCGTVVALARAVGVLDGTASRALSRTPRCTLVVDAAPQPATKAAATVITTTRRPI